MPALVSITVSLTVQLLAPSVPLRVVREWQHPFGPTLRVNILLLLALTRKLSLLTFPPAKQQRPANLRVASLRVMIPLQILFTPTVVRLLSTFSVDPPLHESASNFILEQNSPSN